MQAAFIIVPLPVEVCVAKVIQIAKLQVFVVIFEAFLYRAFEAFAMSIDFIVLRAAARHVDVIRSCSYSVRKFLNSPLTGIRHAVSALSID